jgi:hypothetical protein
VLKLASFFVLWQSLLFVVPIAVINHFKNGKIRVLDLDKGLVTEVCLNF